MKRLLDYIKKSRSSAKVNQRNFKKSAKKLSVIMNIIHLNSILSQACQLIKFTIKNKTRNISTSRIIFMTVIYYNFNQIL